MGNLRYKQNLVADNIDLIEEYKLDKVYQDLISKLFQAEFGVFLNYERGKWENYRLKFESKGETYEEIVEDYNAFLSQSDPLENKIKYHLDYIKRTYYYRGEGEFSKGSYSSYSDLLYLLRYVILGTFDKDLGEAINLQKKYFSDLPDSGFVVSIPELDDITIKSFKNGKVIVKGLTKDELKNLSYIFEVLKR